VGPLAGFTFEMVQTSQVTLSLESRSRGRSRGDGQPQLARGERTRGGNLTVRSDGLPRSSDQIEVSARFKAPPTRQVDAYDTGPPERARPQPLSPSAKAARGYVCGLAVSGCRAPALPSRSRRWCFAAPWSYGRETGCKYGPNAVAT